MADQGIRELERLAADDPTYKDALLRARARAGFLSPAVLAYVHTLDGVDLPTFDQTARFVEWVAAARSWYKHLDGLEPFHFHLDVHAAQSCDRRDDVPSFSEVLEEHRFHHSFRTSEQWREQCGCWAFRWGEGLPDDPEEDDARSVFDGTKWILVPDELGEPAMVGPDVSERTFDSPLPSSGPYYESSKLGHDQLWGMLRAATKFKEAVQAARDAS